MEKVRLTHNAVAGFQREFGGLGSDHVAYHALRAACRSARYSQVPPRWLGRARPDTDGYLILADERAALPVHDGRAVGLLANPAATGAGGLTSGNSGQLT